MRSKSIFATLILATTLAAPASALVLGLDWGAGQSPVTLTYLGEDQTVYAGSLKSDVGGQFGNPLPPNNLAAARNDSDTAAALQLAQWDVMTDNGDGLGVGNLQCVSGPSSKSASLSSLSIAESANKLGRATDLNAVDQYGKTMIILPVPEPDTLGLLGLGLSLVGFGFLRKRS